MVRSTLRLCTTSYHDHYCRCWVRSWSDDKWVLDGYVLQMLFFYGPITIALAVNTALFLTVATKLVRMRYKRK